MPGGLERVVTDVAQRQELQDAIDNLARLVDNVRDQEQQRRRLVVERAARVTEISSLMISHGIDEESVLMDGSRVYIEIPSDVGLVPYDSIVIDCYDEPVSIGLRLDGRSAYPGRMAGLYKYRRRDDLVGEVMRLYDGDYM